MSIQFKVEDANLKGVKIITPFYAEDNRGALIKDYSVEMFSKFNLKHELKEIFYTISQNRFKRRFSNAWSL